MFRRDHITVIVFAKTNPLVPHVVIMTFGVVDASGEFKFRESQFANRGFDLDNGQIPVML